jgi:hypothetical protein
MSRPVEDAQASSALLLIMSRKSCYRRSFPGSPGLCGEAGRSAMLDMTNPRPGKWALYIAIALALVPTIFSGLMAAVFGNA